MAEAPDPLVSDADRDLVVERLRTACAEGRLTLEEFSDRVGDVYRARTDAELEVVTRDLPALPAPEPEGPRPSRWVVGVFSGAKRTGPWRPADRTRAVALLGSAQIDLTEVDLPPVTELVAVALLGGIEVLVPEGVRVDLGGLAVLGGRDDRTTTTRRDGPIVRVTCWVLMGGVTVRTHRFRQ